ncbi:MAG: WG repeat-containing protein [Candidatus Delongbacteria bacterium]|jgi:hypothetical protein|nr:WG repeat-containing protein [Candidatus Delongbacteria bacterium]
MRGKTSDIWDKMKFCVKNENYVLTSLFYEKLIYNQNTIISSSVFELGEIIKNYAVGEKEMADEAFDNKYYEDAFSLYEDLEYEGCDAFITERKTIAKQKALEVFSDNGLVGFIDKDKKVVIDCKYDEAHDFMQGYALVNKGGKYGMINRSGKVIIPFIYDFIFPHFRCGLTPALMLIKGYKKYGYINRVGELKIPFYFDRAIPFENGFAQVAMNGAWSIITPDGNNLSSFVYENIGPYSQGLIAVKINGLWGYANIRMRIKIKPKYEYAKAYSEGLCPVKMDGYYGYVDADDVVQIDFKYNEAYEFSMGSALVNYKGTWYFINKREVIVYHGDYLSDIFNMK